MIFNFFLIISIKVLISQQSKLEIDEFHRALKLSISDAIKTRYDGLNALQLKLLLNRNSECFTSLKIVNVDDKISQIKENLLNNHQTFSQLISNENVTYSSVQQQLSEFNKMVIKLHFF
jgi:hypothetical protein